jgi:hypothetical protein
MQEDSPKDVSLKTAMSNRGSVGNHRMSAKTLRQTLQLGTTQHRKQLSFKQKSNLDSDRSCGCHSFNKSMFVDKEKDNNMPNQSH